MSNTNISTLCSNPPAPIPGVYKPIWFHIISFIGYNLIIETYHDWTSDSVKVMNRAVNVSSRPVLAPQW